MRNDSVSEPKEESNMQIEKDDLERKGKVTGIAVCLLDPLFKPFKKVKEGE